MDRPLKFCTVPQHKWITLDIYDVGDKYILEQKTGYAVAQHYVEVAFLVVTAVLFGGAYLMFILPEIFVWSSYHGMSLSAAIICLALFLYAFGTRGHKAQVGVDKIKKEVWICKVNPQGHARLVTRFSKTDIRSIYVKRAKAPDAEAELTARFNGKALPVKLLSGNLKDIEAAHSVLCASLKSRRHLRWRCQIFPRSRQANRAVLTEIKAI